MKKLIRLPEVVERTAKSRSGIYADIKDGLFPPPVGLGPRAVAWVSGEIDAYIDAIIAGFSGGRLRAFVAEMVASRPKQMVKTPW